MHLEHYNRPALQIRVIRILWMVPIYALDAWLSLRFSDARIYIDPLRECYEAFVIYNFYGYLVAYLEEEYGDLDTYFGTKPPIQHPWPVNKILEPWEAGQQFFWETKRGVLSYVITRPLLTAVGVVAGICNVYGDGEFRHDRVYPYIAFFGSISQTWALYCLILMYQGTKEELRPLRPLAKFLVIKVGVPVAISFGLAGQTAGLSLSCRVVLIPSRTQLLTCAFKIKLVQAVVFLTFWQSVAIALASKFGLLRPAPWSTYDSDDVAAGLQNFLICIEMFAAAIAHAHAFPPRVRVV